MGVKVVNKATGEYVELNYDSFDDFAAQYDEAVRQIVEGAAGDSSRNEFFEVDPKHAGARGLP